MGNVCCSPGRAWNPPPPEGYTPVVGFKLCPPGGLYADLLLWAADYVNDAVQLTTFARHGDGFFAILIAGSIGLSSFFTYAAVYAGHKTTISAAIRDSVARGVATKAWRAVMAAERGFEAPVSGLIAPYGMALNAALTQWQAGSAVLGLALSAKAIAAQQVEVDAARKADAAAIVAPQQMALLKMWRFCGAAAELSAFAVASRALHPLLVTPWYMLGAAANVYVATAEDKGVACIGSAVSPVVDMFGRGPSPLALRAERRLLPGAPIMVATLVRLAAWGALCWAIDWKEGMRLEWGSLGRPMGRQVLHEHFLWPCATVAETAVACAGSTYKYLATQGKEALECSLEASHGVSAGSILFNGSLLGVCAVSMLFYILGLILHLIFNHSFRRGDLNHDLAKKVEEKDTEIQAWGDQQAEGYDSLTANLE